MNARKATLNAATEVNPSAAAEPTAAKPEQPKPAQRAISDPREVATVVMARMNQVNVKKDERAMAINGLVDITQQLTKTYAAQLVAIEQLRRRVKALEGRGATPTEPQATATVQ